MDYLDWYILFYLLIFIVFFVVDYFIILKGKYKNIVNGNSKRKQKKQEIKIMEIEYLSMKFKLKKDLILKQWVLLWCAFINSIIITAVSVIISIVPLDMIWQLMMGFALLMGLIYSLYELFGRYLVKKGLY